MQGERLYPPSKAHLQAVHLGMHAAHSLGVSHLDYTVPNTELLKQVSDLLNLQGPMLGLADG